MNPILSIIIPHFNSVDSVKKLLNTIVYIDSSKIEILLIDDNSDECLLLDLKKMISAEFNESVRLIQNESGDFGSGAARNVGLSYAIGEWIIFADSDDVFVENFYAEVCENLEQGIDMIYYIPTSIDEFGNKGQRVKTYLKHYEKYFNDEDEGGVRYSLPIVWSRVYNREFILENEILFDTVKVSNDVMFSMRAGVKAKKIKVMKSTIYCWCLSNGSLTTKVSKEKFDSKMETIIKANEYLYKSTSKDVFYKNRKTLPKPIATSLFRNKLGISYTIKLVFRLRKARFGLFRFSDFLSFSNFFKNNKYYN